MYELCKFCKECRGENINIEIVKSNSRDYSDLKIIKCNNYEYNGIYLLSERV